MGTLIKIIEELKGDLEMVEIRVYGIPRPQGSKRHVAGESWEASRHVGQWRNDVMSAAAAARQGTDHRAGSLKSCLVPRPKSHFGTGRNADKLKARVHRALHQQSPWRHVRADPLYRRRHQRIVGYPVIEDDSQKESWSREAPQTDAEGRWGSFARD